VVAVATLVYQRRPSILGALMRGMMMSRRRKVDRIPPDISVSWRNLRATQRLLDRYRQYTGQSEKKVLPFLLPQVMVFPIHLVILTHKDFPFPLLGSLQIRNQFLSHRPIVTGEEMEAECHVVEQREAEKGVEVDLHTTVWASGEKSWESLVTYYYKGAAGGNKVRPGQELPPDVWPGEDEASCVTWRAPGFYARRFGRLSGDFNPVHFFPVFARRMRFQGAIHHPHLILGQVMDRLGLEDKGGNGELSLWLKGPVYYNAGLRLCSREIGREKFFALYVDGDDRPAMLGGWNQEPPVSLWKD